MVGRKERAANTPENIVQRCKLRISAFIPACRFTGQPKAGKPLADRQVCATQACIFCQVSIAVGTSVFLKKAVWFIALLWAIRGHAFYT
jgi:hypothetical protein